MPFDHDDQGTETIASRILSMSTQKLQISDWFLLEHEKMEDNFPDLPSEQEGGSSAINAAAPNNQTQSLQPVKKPAKAAPPGGKGTPKVSAKNRLDTLALLLHAQYATHLWNWLISR